MRPLYLVSALLIGGLLGASGSGPDAPAADAPSQAGATRADTCAFTQQQPRYWVSRTPLTVFNIASKGSSLFLNDALLRTLARQLGLADCQVLLTQGERCSAVLAGIRCADPLWLCDGEVTISNSVYQAAKGGLCTGGSDSGALSPVCQTLLDYPSIAQYAAADSCEPVCFAQLTHGSSGGGNSSHDSLAPPPPPASASDGCYSFTLQVDSAAEQDARTAASDLHNVTTAGALVDDLISYSANKDTARIKITIDESDVSPVVGFGYFPPPSPPPSPPPPSPPPPSPPPPSPPPPSPPPPSPPPPSPPPPLVPFQPGNATDDPSSSTQSVDDTAQLQYGDWRQCSADCGDGWQTRTASCLSEDGSMLALGQCPGSGSAITARPCRGPSCNAAYWQYSAWDACNATCGGGISRRSATCQAPADSSCDAADKLAVKQVCNTASCKVHMWRAEEWGTCSTTCGGGIQARFVACVDPAGRDVANELCAATKPPAEQRCNIQPCDFCSANQCFGHGFCANGACTCSAGSNFTGASCQVPLDCPSGLVDAQLQCCASGTVDSQGLCCPAGSVLDAGGSCCTSGTLDACGVCDGSGKFVDVAGTCCATLLGADGMCCQSNVVDECGVCDGMGNSCSIDMALSMTVGPQLVFGDSIEEAALEAFLANLTDALQLPAGAISLDALQEAGPPTDELAVSSATDSGRRRLLAKRQAQVHATTNTSSTAEKLAASPLYLTVTVSLDPDSAAESTGQFSAAYMAAVLQQFMLDQPASDVVQLTNADDISRAGVCGNGICEVAERTVDGTCPQDCPFATKTCPTTCGDGTCLPASGTCECFAGYTGATCQECAAGHTQVNGACVVNVVDMGFAVYNPPAPGPENADVNGGNTLSDDRGSSVNVGAIVGPIIAVAVVALAVAGFLLHRRRKAFHNFASHYPTNSDGRSSGKPSEGGRDDVESQLFASAHGTAADSDTRSLREKFASASSSQAGGGSGIHSLRQSQEEGWLRSSQDKFRGMSQGDQLRQSTGSLHQQISSLASQPLRHSLSGSSGAVHMIPVIAAGGITSCTPMLGDSHLRQSVSSLGSKGQAVDSHPSSSHNSGASGSSSGNQQRASALDSSHLMAESPALVDAASMVVHPVMSAHPSMSGLSMPPAVDASLGHYTEAMKQSYTASPMDSQARLFFNPAFGAEDVSRMSESRSIISSSHVPRPGFAIRMPLTARPSCVTVVKPAQRRSLAVSQSMDSTMESLDTHARRDKLEKLRVAVEALELDAAEGRLTSRGSTRLAAPGELESPPGTLPSARPMNMRASVESVCWVGQEDQEDQVSPLALSQSDSQRKFLEGRPDVPKLQLGRLQPSGGQQALAAAAAMADVPAAQPAKPVPSKLKSWSSRVSVQSARIPAANFSTIDASLHRSPTKLPYPPAYSSSQAELVSGASGRYASDPLDSLEDMLDAVRAPQPQLTAREAIAQSFSKLLNPLVLGRRQQDVDWAGQLSSRGRGTPRSWAEDSGMQRTRAEGSLQRSREELEDEPSTTHSSSGAVSGTATRFFNTPRGQLLRSLAAEAAAAQKQRSLRETRQALPAGYDSVMDGVDAALRSATSSPTKIPLAQQASSAPRGAGVDAAISAKLAAIYKSPSRIPRLAPLGIPAVHANENLDSAPASPDKEQPGAAAAAGGRFGNVLRGSLENLRGGYR